MVRLLPLTHVMPGLLVNVQLIVAMYLYLTLEAMICSTVRDLQEPRLSFFVLIIPEDKICCSFWLLACIETNDVEQFGLKGWFYVHFYFELR